MFSHRWDRSFHFDRLICRFPLRVIGFSSVVVVINFQSKLQLRIRDSFVMMCNPNPDFRFSDFRAILGFALRIRATNTRMSKNTIQKKILLFSRLPSSLLHRSYVGSKNRLTHSHFSPIFMVRSTKAWRETARKTVVIDRDRNDGTGPGFTQR